MFLAVLTSSFNTDGGAELISQFRLSPCCFGVTGQLLLIVCAGKCPPNPNREKDPGTAPNLSCQELLVLICFPPFGRTLTTSAWTRVPSAWPTWQVQAQQMLLQSINHTSTTMTATATAIAATTTVTAALLWCPMVKEFIPERCWWTGQLMNFQKAWIPLKKRWQHCWFDAFVA